MIAKPYRADDLSGSPAISRLIPPLPLVLLPPMVDLKVIAAFSSLRFVDSDHVGRYLLCLQARFSPRIRLRWDFFAIWCLVLFP